MDTNENTHEGKRLQELSGSDFEIKDGQPHIKGWTIKSENGETIGEVEDLIFDVRDRKVRYLVADLEDNDWDLESRDVLIPIGMAELDENNDHVILPDVTASQLSTLPDYHKDELTFHTESAVRTAFTTGNSSTHVAGSIEQANPEDDFYSHNHFDEGRLTRRRISAGSRLPGSDPDNSDQEFNPNKNIL